jgi:light-regulated signal transduction histidine kinase (bacteriophytochrome)
LRYFKSVSKLTELNGGRLFIGINSDITEQHISNMALEERNRELEQSNKELASFNHIASHDLQEPLRKIQTFISRLSEKESLNLSESGKEYLSKIQTSLIRMRGLIDDLLQFSRTRKNEKNFELASLSLLLENAKQELIQDIEEKKAEIRSSDLPVLKVIPFQIQQLFINLIGNSLKYSKPGIAPVIKIYYEEINADEYPFLRDKIQKRYNKISINDNGLGFEQQYAQDIFILFYRLHSKSEYTGSGIGLSICKKIVENHDGYILAESTPGFGSTFSFFLP